MPAPDPNNPTTSQGPFSQYLDPVKGIQDTQLEQRPSGFMGTTGKLAMFGSQLLKGLAAGKMQKYARTEQQKYEQFEQKSRQVQAIQADPDIPNEVKAKAALLLQQSWGTLTKEQLGELKKLHGKEEGPAAHIRGLLGSVVDKLSGETPAQHTLGGSKDTKQPFDELNNLLADVHTGGEKYSIKSGFDGTFQKLNSQVKYAEDLQENPQAKALFDKLASIDERRAANYLKVLPKRPTSEQIIDRRMAGKLEDKYNQQGIPPAGDRGPGPVASGQLLPGMVGVEAPAEPARDGRGESPRGNSDYTPWKAGVTGLEVKNKDDEELVMDLAKRSPAEKSFWLHTYTDSKGKEVTDHVQLHSWPKFNVAVDTRDPEKRIDMSQGKWEPSTATGPKPPTPAKDKTKWVDVERNGRKLQVKFDDDGNEVPGSKPRDRGPVKAAKGPKGPDPLAQSLKEIRLEIDKRTLAADDDKLEDVKRKRAVKGITDKIMRQIQETAQAKNVPVEYLLDQRINDFGVWYKNDPRLEGNFDDIQEVLKKRKHELATMKSSEALAAEREQTAESTGATPPPQPRQQAPQQSTPVQQAPQPQKQAAPAAPQQGGQISVTDPKGGVHLFPNQAAADRFKQLAGIK